MNKIMKKTIYTQPLCEVIVVKTEHVLQATSRFSQTGSTISTNTTNSHYSDPTGHVETTTGGESLGKHNQLWEYDRVGINW